MIYMALKVFILASAILILMQTAVTLILFVL